MRQLNGPIKHSGDVHPPELDDGFDDDEDLARAEAAPARPSARPAPTARTKSSWMPLLGWIAGGVVLYRLMR
jgi:hypothetical protein